MDGLEWRAPTHADLPAWAAALAAIEMVDRSGEVIDEQDLADQLGLSYFDAERDGRLVRGADGEIVAWGTVLCVPGARQRRVSLDGAVHPDRRDRGVGSALLAWQVARGLEVGATRDTSVEGWLEVSADERDALRSDLFRDHGFAPLRYYLEMRRPLGDAVPEPAVLPGLDLVPFDAAADEATRAAHNDTFRDHWGATGLDRETWTTWVTGHHSFRADRSFLVLDAGEIAGYALNSLHPADWPGLGFREGWTHQLGVRRRWRGRGVAKALLHATMRAFAADHLDFAALDVDADNPTGALALYEGVGYRRDRCRVAWAHPLP